MSSVCVHVKQQSSICHSSAREPVSCHQSIESIIWQLLGSQARYELEFDWYGKTNQQWPVFKFKPLQILNNELSPARKSTLYILQVSGDVVRLRGGISLCLISSNLFIVTYCFLFPLWLYLQDGFLKMLEYNPTCTLTMRGSRLVPVTRSWFTDLLSCCE